MRFRIAFVAALSLTAGVSNAGAAQEAPKLVRFSFTGGWDALPALVAIERGFFAREGLVVSGMPVSNPRSMIQSVVQGSSDFALVPQRTLLVMAGSKLKFGVVGMSGWGAQMELIVPLADATTTGLANLKGKRIAVSSGSEALPVLVRLLNTARLEPRDVRILRLSTEQLSNALKAGKADAVMETRQLTSAIIRKGNARVVMSNLDITRSIGRIGATPLIVNDRMMNRNKETVQRFLNAWVKALTYIQRDPADAAVVLRIYFHRQGLKVPATLARTWVGMVKYDRYIWTKADIADAEYNGWGLKAGGVLKIQPKLAGHIHNEFADKAMRDVQLAVRAPAPEK